MHVTFARLKYVIFKENTSIEYNFNYFVRNNIQYVKDPVNFEYVEDPKTCLATKTGDLYVPRFSSTNNCIKYFS